jgi:hypothetical protein
MTIINELKMENQWIYKKDKTGPNHQKFRPTMENLFELIYSNEQI